MHSGKYYYHCLTAFVRCLHGRLLSFTVVVDSWRPFDTVSSRSLGIEEINFLNPNVIQFLNSSAVNLTLRSLKGFELIQFQSDLWSSCICLVGTICWLSASEVLDWLSHFGNCLHEHKNNYIYLHCRDDLVLAPWELLADDIQNFVHFDKAFTNLCENT